MPTDYETRIFTVPDAPDPQGAGDLARWHTDSSARLDFFARVLGAVPLGWSDVSGLLEPRIVHVAEGRVARDAGYRLDRFGTSLGEIVARPFDDRHRRAGEAPARPDPAALIVDGRLPAFVSFNDVGFDSDWKLAPALRVAQGFVRMGYEGHLSVNNGRARKYAHEMPAILRLHLSPWSDWQADPGPRLRPAVVLEWSPALRGSIDQFGEILGICEVFAGEHPEPSR